jgi:ribosomal protein L7/L12
MSFLLTVIVATAFVLTLFALVRAVLYRVVGQENLRRVDRVVAGATGLPLPHESADQANDKPFQLSDHVLELAIDPKRKIEACKAMRDETGCSLAEAKREVERIYARYQQIAAQPATQPATQPDSQPDR